MTRQNFLFVRSPSAHVWSRRHVEPVGDPAPAGRKALICRQIRLPKSAGYRFRAVRGFSEPSDVPRYTLGFRPRNQGVAFAFIRLRGYGRRRWLLWEIFPISRDENYD